MKLAPVATPSRRPIPQPHRVAPLYPPGRLVGLRVSGSTRRPTLAIPDEHRLRGISIHAGSGSGKSAMLGKSVSVQDFLRGLPQVILDPHGPLIDNFLLTIARLPSAVQRLLWPRVRYVDLSGKGDHVTAFPLLYRLPDESLRDAADRLLEALRKVNPHLARAPIMGLPALLRIGRPILMILTALNEPITAAEQLLRLPEEWDDRIRAAEQEYPELEAAAQILRQDYPSLKPAERMNLTRSFLVEIAPFALDPTLKAMFAAAIASVDLAEVEARRQIVLLDTRRETNTFRRAFKTRWVYEWFMSYIKARGTTYALPIGLIIDELTELTNQVSLDIDLFARDLDELINVYARNYGIWTTLAHQEMFQLSSGTQKSLLTMGTQVFGVTADMEAAKYIAEQFLSIDPYFVKRVDNVWGGSTFGSVVVEEREAFMPLEEQILRGAQRLMALQPFEFLVKRKDSPRMIKTSARRLVDSPWPSDHTETLAYIRQQLALRTGVPRSERSPLPIVPPTDIGALGRMRDTTYDTTHDTGGDFHADEDDWSTPPPS